MMNLNFEEKSKILDKLPGMVFQCMYDPPNFPFIFASEGCEDLMGNPPEDFTSGLKLIDIVRTSDIDDLLTQMDATLSIGAPLETVFTIITQDSAEKTVLMRCRVSQTNAEGMPHVIEGLLTDITKSLRMESSRQDNQEITDFWTKMGHGVRTPMNAIIGLAELGLREDMPQMVREYTQIIKKAGEKLMSVLNNIMDYTRLSRGELEIKPEPYNLPDMISDIVDITKTQIQGTSLDFVVYVDSHIPHTLIGDAERVRQVLLNVLSNAVKFSDTGYISLSIESKATKKATNLVITIEDTGRGIKEEDMSLLFKEFAQFDSKNIDGGGLGLVIANNLARLMGGDIQVSSMYNVGSMFTITIPQNTNKEVSSQSTLTKINNPEAISVLVYERRKVCNAAIMRTFKNLGIKSDSVNSPKDFQAALDSNKHSFIFASNVLYEEYKRWNPGYTPSAKLVLMTEYGEVVTTDDAVATLSKPILYLNVADILNEATQRIYGTKSETVIRFTAPEARILIVDDISANLTVAEGLLQPYKMTVDTCENGSEAIKFAKINNYDLIFMDYRMPVMDGVECTKLIRDIEDCATVPIVALTANTEYASQEMFRQNSFDDLLAKPIELAKLNAIVEKWIPKSKQEEISDAKTPKGVVASPMLEIPGVDIVKGITGTGGNMELYMRVLGKYFEDGTRMLTEIKTSMEKEDIALYLVKVHALNSLSASIGAIDLSKMAAELEQAAEEKDIDCIITKTPKFLQELEILLNNINPIVAKRRVLIVDDTEAYLLILNDILKDEYETIISTDGEDGLETAKLTKPHLILMDIVMPGMSGYDVLTKIRADEELKDIPVILISGKSSEQNEFKGYTLGANGYIKKPFEKEIVLEKVKSILGDS